MKDQDHWIVPTISESAAAPPNVRPADVPSGKVDINTADAELLETLPGIGEVRALAVIRHREEHGPFKQVDDIVAVPGIGPAILEGIRGLIEVR